MGLLHLKEGNNQTRSVLCSVLSVLVISCTFSDNNYSQENMFGKGNFNGQFRTTPTVSIRGATKSESKEELLRRAHDERLRREVNRITACYKLKYQTIATL